MMKHKRYDTREAWAAALDALGQWRSVERQQGSPLESAFVGDVYVGYWDGLHREGYVYPDEVSDAANTSV